MALHSNLLHIANFSSISIPRRTQSRASVSAPWEEKIPPNAVHRRRSPSWRGGFSLGVDLGFSRTGLALSKGFSIRPLTVLELRGQKLELRLLDIAEIQEVDEFIVGLPKSSDGKETEQSNKVRSVAGRLAVRAAERGWRVYLQDEHGTSTEAVDHMIAQGLSKSARQGNIDAYAAVVNELVNAGGDLLELKTKFSILIQNKFKLVSTLLSSHSQLTHKVLERYFSDSGYGIELVVPKQVELQNKLRKGPAKDLDFFPEE